MDDEVQVSPIAARAIEDRLRGRRETVAVQNVENDPKYQRMDVDLIWITHDARYQIEIKGDRWHRTGNFFFETVSNKERGTPGCFLYTEADYIFYYFITPRTLYILPMPKTREWFLANEDRFRIKETTTPVGNGQRYTTVGRLVPIGEVLRAVSGAKKRQL